MSDQNLKSAGSSQGNSGRFKKGQHWRKPKLHWNRKWLYNAYVKLGRSASDIAKEMGCTENAILFWLAKHKIKTRSMSQIRKAKKWGLYGADNPMFGRCGDKNPRWIDGSSPERQTMYARSFWKELVRVVYERDGYRCKRCLSAHTQTNRLHAHHVKPWAGNAATRFVLSNIVTLCKICHNWVHSRENVRNEFLSS